MSIKTGGDHSRPAFLKSPTSSFFLVSTELTGSPAANAAVTLSLIMDELRIAVRMTVALAGLAVGLQAELLLMQQFANHGTADPMALCHQGQRQLRQNLAGLAQRRHRIAALARVHQRQPIVE